MNAQPRVRPLRVRRALVRLEAVRDNAAAGLWLLLAAALPPVLFAFMHHVRQPGGLYLAAMGVAMVTAGLRGALIVAAEAYVLLIAQIFAGHYGAGPVYAQIAGLTIAMAVILVAIVAIHRARAAARSDAAWYGSLFETRAVGVLVADSERRFVAGNAKVAEEELHEKTLLLERAARVGGVGTWIWDASSNRTDWSDQARRIYDFDDDEADTCDPGLFWRIVHPDDREEVERLMNASLATAGVCELEHRIVRRGGEVGWIRARGDVECDADGNVVRQLGAVIDVTEARQTQRELKEAQRLAKVGSWVWGVDENDMIAWSDSLARMLGRDPALPLPTFAERNRHYTDETRERLDSAFDETLRTGVPWECELELVHEDGRRIWMWSRGEVERDANGRVVKLRGSFQDITARREAEQALHEKTLLLERAQQVGGVGSWAWYPAEHREVWSEEAQRIFGFSPDEAATGDPDLFYGVLHPDDRERIMGLTWESFATDTRSQTEYRIFRRSDGALRWVREQAVAEFDDDGLPLRVLGAVTDITESRQVEQTLRETAAELTRAQQLGRVGSWAWYPHENRNVWSEEAQRIYGLTAEEAETGDPALFFELVHPEEREEISRRTREAFEGAHTSAVEYRIVRKDGDVRWLRGRGDVECDADGKPYRMVGVVLDITEQQAANEELERLAFSDPLTGLTNRTSFYRRLDLAVEQAERGDAGSLAVLYIDLDDFKLVNDSFGHEAGDALLRETASRLRDRTRAGDLIGRQGGDEFLVLLTDTDGEGAELVSRNLLEALQLPFAVVGADVHLSASIGISVFPLDARSSEELLKHADTAMYTAKHAGRNNAQTYARSSDSALTQISITTGLHRALDRDELVLHYQPIFDLVGGEMLSVEALIRWNHPERGLVLPEEFISAAERSGLIAPISNWVAREACRQAAQWTAEGLDLPVAFNLPPGLWQPGLMRHLLATMAEFDLSADRMIVEITESALSEDLGRQEPLVDQLRAAGLRLSIDDFGTGHSSLSRLAQLPVSTLKIDHSFIRDIPGDVAAATVVTSIIQLAHNLGLEPLAEGIETPEQLDFLISRGCTVGQGFLLGAPMPAGAIAPLLRARGGVERRAA